MIRPCPTCGTKNRVPAAHLADEGVCGKCRSTLPALAEPLEVGQDELDEVVRDARVPVLVDFWAEWCGPCRAATAEVEAVAATQRGRAIVLKVDTDRHAALAGRYGVRALPTFLVLKEGKPVMEQAGLVDAHTLAEWLARAR